MPDDITTPSLGIFGLRRMDGDDQELGEGDRWLGFARASKGADGTTDVIASSPVEDSYKDIVAGPWNLSRFRSNPVVPWGHDYNTPPVGRAKSTKYTKSDGILRTTIEWWDTPLNPLGQMVAEGFRKGFLNAVSVGFRPGKVVRRSQLADDDPRKADSGLLLTNNELLEVSAVTIPANPQALAQRYPVPEIETVHPDDMADQILSLLRSHDGIRAELSAMAALSSPGVSDEQIADVVRQILAPKPMGRAFGLTVPS